MLKHHWLLIVGLLFHPPAPAQLLQRELGNYDLSLGTTPSRSMAQGLIKPTAVGSFHGGLDLAHDSGWYVGQWAPSMGLSPSSTLEIDSYVGFKQPFDSTLGYEVGMIHYSYPDLRDADSQAVYAGLNLLGNRFGAAFSDDSSRRTSTLFTDLGGLSLLNLDLSMTVTHHQLGTPFSIGNGEEVRAFNDWTFQISRPWMGIDLNLIYSGSSLNAEGCQAWVGQDPQCSGMLTLKAERAFF